MTKTRSNILLDSESRSDSAHWIAETIARHKARAAVGTYSVCSAHPTVVAAAIEQAAADGSYALIEATSNQVDQFGGYTGLRPADFRDLVFGVADEYGFPRTGSCSVATTSGPTDGSVNPPMPQCVTPRCSWRRT